MKTNNGILIVEDDNDVRVAIADILKFRGATVYEATNGLEALNLLPEIPLPDLVILDAMMPEMDGPAFFAEFRKREEYRNVPVVLFSAVVDSIHIEGLAGRLKKPADMREILELVEKFCPASAGTASP